MEPAVHPTNGINIFSPALRLRAILAFSIAKEGHRLMAVFLLAASGKGPA